MMGSSRWRHQAQAYQFLATAQGQWGLRHSVGLALWEHVAEHGDYPSRSEIQRIYETVQRNHERVAAGNLGVCGPALTAIWEKRMECERELAEKHLIGAAA